MTPERWAVIQERLEAALALEPEKRTSFLTELGTCDPEMRDELESLLAHESAVNTFLQTAAPRSLRETLSAHTEHDGAYRDPMIGRTLGAYQITALLAEGGMGEVYRAFRADDQYKKEVAVKLVRAGHDSATVVSRFKNERQILASLDHPNIARLLDGGTTSEGVPYLVMDLIDGQPITAYCEQHKLSLDARLNLFRTVCSAVHYAHQHLIIHRDIKPTNILVTAEGVPKLLDFGIAKILDPGLLPELNLTAAGLWMMTPEYASPEQLRGEPINTATDVYSLGLVLYEMLTGCHAYTFRSRMPHDVVRVVLETDPRKPSTAIRRTEDTGEEAWEKAPPPAETAQSVRDDSLKNFRRQLAGDLDIIVLKAFRKEPGARYASADQFSEDIFRHLEGLPVLARKSTVAYRCRKYALRHKVAVTAAALVLISLLLGITFTAREARIARANELRAERRFNDVRKLSDSLIFEIHDSIQNLPGATPARKLLLQRARQYLDGLALESSRDLALQRDLAAAYERVGSLQGTSLDANTGETEAGITSLQKAASIADAVAKANPGNVDDELNAARVHSQLCSVLAGSGHAEARGELEKAIAITNRLLSVDPSNAKVLVEQGIEYDHLAFFRDDAGDVRGASESLQKALAIGEILLKSAPQDTKRMNRVAIERVRLSNELVMLGRRTEALRFNSAGLDLFGTLTEDQTNAKARREMAVAIVFRGNIQMMEGDTRGALASYQRSLAMLQGLERADPQNTLYQLDVSGAMANVARALANTGKSAEGLAMLEKAIGVLEQNYARNHSYTDIPYWLGQDHIWRGEILARSGNVRGALVEYRSGASRLESSINGTDNINIRCDIATSYAKIAAAFASLDDSQQASAFYSKALKIAEPLALANPPSVPALYAAADAYFGTGDAVKNTTQQSTRVSPEKRQGQLREACDWYRKSANAWGQIPNPARITPSGFATQDPEAVAKELRRCDEAPPGPEAAKN